jgi:hypothetical protein
LDLVLLVQHPLEVVEVLLVQLEERVGQVFQEVSLVFHLVHLVFVEGGDLLQLKRRLQKIQRGTSS